MKAMVLNNLTNLHEDSIPLRMEEWAVPEPGENELLIKISACGICHTELDEIEGRTPPPRLPVILGHQVVGRVVKSGKNAGKYQLFERVGVAWIFSSCGKCH